jgi:hypothetical protein
MPAIYFTVFTKGPDGLLSRSGGGLRADAVFGRGRGGGLSIGRQNDILSIVARRGVAVK